MRKAIAILLGQFLLSMCCAWAQRSVPREENNPRPELLNARAVLEIKSEGGVCFWTISGDNDLVRLPIEDERFSAILLSTNFEGAELHLTMAGERAPLDTTPLGRVDLAFDAATPATVDSFRAVKSRSESGQGRAEPQSGLRGWELRLLRPDEKIDTINCCHCPPIKLACCPNPSWCVGCGACGTCCGD